MFVCFTEDRSVASASSSFSFPPQRIAEDATVLAEDEASSTDVVKNSLTASDTPVRNVFVHGLSCITTICKECVYVLVAHVSCLL